MLFDVRILKVSEKEKHKYMVHRDVYKIIVIYFPCPGFGKTLQSRFFQNISKQIYFSNQKIQNPFINKLQKITFL